MKGFGALGEWVKKGAVASFISLALAGCQTTKDIVLYKPAGDATQWLSEEHVVPYVLGTEDLAVSCAMSESLSPLLMAFGRVTQNPDQLAVMMNMAGGACEEERALNHELRYTRALKQQKPDRAEDALISQKRHLVYAAKRQYAAWLNANAYYGEIGKGECPPWSSTGSRMPIDPRGLNPEFEQFIYMAGLLAGLQAINNEIQSTTSIGVPKNIGSLVERGASCLDDNDWWGVPVAMKAVVWVMIPGAVPKGEDPWARLEAADKKGEKARVRLSHVLHALAAYTKGDLERVKDIIRNHAKQVKKRPANPDYLLIDKIATTTLLSLSDRLWTENMGHRTPMGGLGTFWDDKKESDVEVMDLDDFL